MSVISRVFYKNVSVAKLFFSFTLSLSLDCEESAIHEICKITTRGIVGFFICSFRRMKSRGFILSQRTRMLAKLRRSLSTLLSDIKMWVYITHARAKTIEGFFFHIYILFNAFDVTSYTFIGIFFLSQGCLEKIRSWFHNESFSLIIFAVAIASAQVNNYTLIDHFTIFNLTLRWQCLFE